MYRNISLVFIACIAVMIVGVVMFFYSQAVVIVTAVSRDVAIDFEAQIKTTPTTDEVRDRDIVSGTIVKRQYVASTTVAVASTKTVVSDIVGTVTLINNSNRNQPLVRTTQLADSAGIVVRTNDTVVVPAGGSVSVAVYPRDPETFTGVPVGRLTIIKLAPILQPEIYGEVKDALTSEPRELKVITDSELNRAKQELSEKVIGDIRKELALAPSVPVAVDFVNTAIVGNKVGDYADSFTYQGTVKVNIIEANQEQLRALLQRKIEEVVPVGAVVESPELDAVTYTLKEELSADSVLIDVSQKVTAVIDEHGAVLDRQQLINKSPDEVRQHLLTNQFIQDVSVRLVPYWRNTLPGNPDRIKIEIR
jgi:hypothetical protein